MYKLPERGGWGEGEVIWAMPERKILFFRRCSLKRGELNVATVSNRELPTRKKPSNTEYVLQAVGRHPLTGGGNPQNSAPPHLFRF